MSKALAAATLPSGDSPSSELLLCLSFWHGLNCVPPNSYMEGLTTSPSTRDCDCIQRQGPSQSD